MSAGWCSATSQGVRLVVHVIPNAKRTEVVGVLDGALKIRLQAQPIEGKANEALMRYLAETLGVPKSKVAVTHGQSSRKKIVEIATALRPEDVESALYPPA